LANYQWFGGSRVLADLKDKMKLQIASEISHQMHEIITERVKERVDKLDITKSVNEETERQIRRKVTEEIKAKL
jgi:citrate lyase gamma subunit